MVTQLLYLSTSNLTGSPIEIEIEVTRILSTAYLNNRRRGVTGILFHCSSHFLQLLEGPKKGVDGAMSLITRDPRHRDIEVLFERQVDRLALPSLAMGCAGLGGQCPDVLVEALRVAEAHSAEEAGALLLDYLMDCAREVAFVSPQSTLATRSSEPPEILL